MCLGLEFANVLQVMQMWISILNEHYLCNTNYSCKQLNWKVSLKSSIIKKNLHISQPKFYNI